MLTTTSFDVDSPDPARSNGQPDARTAAWLAKLGVPTAATRVKSATKRGGTRSK